MTSTFITSNKPTSQLLILRKTEKKTEIDNLTVTKHTKCKEQKMSDKTYGWQRTKHAHPSRYWMTQMKPKTGTKGLKNLTKTEKQQGWMNNVSKTEMLCHVWINLDEYIWNNILVWLVCVWYKISVLGSKRFFGLILTKSFFQMWRKDDWAHNLLYFGWEVMVCENNHEGWFWMVIAEVWIYPNPSRICPIWICVLHWCSSGGVLHLVY